MLIQPQSTFVPRNLNGIVCACAIVIQTFAHVHTIVFKFLGTQVDLAVSKQTTVP